MKWMKIWLGGIWCTQGISERYSVSGQSELGHSVHFRLFDAPIAWPLGKNVTLSYLYYFFPLLVKDMVKLKPNLNKVFLPW